MLRRIIYFFLVIVLLGGLGGLIAFYAFDFKPKMIAGFIAWVELRSKRSKFEMQVRTNTECQADSRG